MKEPESENAISDEMETSNFPEKTDSTDQTNSNAVSQSEDKISVTKTDKITRWGWFSYRPNWLQVFNKPTWLCSSVGSLYFTQAMVMWGFLFISISSIETRFNLSSTAVGVIIASYDIFSAIFVLFVAYYSNYGSKSRILAVGCFGMGLGSFIFMLPHFTSGPYMYSETNITQTVCNPMINATDHCEGDDWQPSSLSYYFIVFIIAQFFHGVGGTPVYTVSPVYMDENASDKRSATYIGIIYACSCIGPAVGFILGGYFLTIYTDIRYADSVNITPEHPAWVGAWWLGFLIGWLLAWIVAVPLSGFPGELPAKEEMRAKRTVQTHESKSQAKASQPGFGTSFRDFPASFWLLCKNPAYICTTLGASAALLIVVGFAAFLPKFIENQFHQTSGTAAVLLGVTFVPGAAGGTYLGGWIVKRLELKVRGMILMIIVMTIAVMVMALMFMIKCPEEQLAGVFVPYEPNRTEVSEVNLVSPCNEDCGCIMDIYSPVCGANGLQYFDSCYAGCMHFDEEHEKFYNCRCVWNETWLSRDHGGHADIGKCDTECESWKLPVFMFLLFVIMVFVFCRTVPGVTLQMRLVPDNQRPFAMGIASLCAKLLGGVPGPIIFGAAVDKSCVLWHYDCEQRGACWVYDPLEFSLRLVLLGVTFSAVSLVLMIIAYVSYKPPTSEDGEAEFLDLANETDQVSSRAPPGVELLAYKDAAKSVDGESTGSDVKGIVREDSQAALVDSELRDSNE